jgi:AraC-like DNA-binding protein
LAVFSLFLFRHVSTLLIDSAIDEAHARVEVLQTAVEGELQAVADAAVKIGSSQRLRPFRLAQSPANAYFAVQALGDFRLPTSVVEEIFLYFYGDRYVLSSSSTVGVDRLHVVVDSVDDAHARFLAREVLRPRSSARAAGPLSIALFGTAPRRYLLVQYPVPSWGIRSYATLSFVLSVDELFDRSSDDSDSARYVIESPGGVRVASGDLSGWIDEWNEVTTADLFSGGVLEVDGPTRRVIAVGAVGPVTGWRVYALTDRRAVTRPATDLQRLTLAVLLATACGAFVIVALLVRLNYRPVQSLLDTLAAATPETRTIDSLKQAHESLTGLIRHERDLESEVGRRRDSVREGVVTQLLAGQSMGSGDLEGLWIGKRRAGSGLGIEAPSTGHVYCVLAIRSPERCASGEVVVSVLRSLVVESRGDGTGEERGAHWLFRAGVASEPTVAIARFESSSGGPDEVERHAHALLRGLVAEWGGGAVVAVGPAVGSTADVARSYDAALRALEQHFVLGVDRVIRADAVRPAESPSIWQGIPLMIDPVPFRQGAMTGSLGDVRDYLGQIGTQLRESMAPAHVARGLCMEICRIVAKLAAEIHRRSGGVDRAREGSAVGQRACADGVSEFATFKDFGDSIVGDLENLAAARRELRDGQSLDLLAGLRREIDARFADPQFSIQALAEDFDVSPSTVSSVFRRYDGRGANSYLALRRIDEAQRLLRSSDLPLKDIAGRVGYYNVSSFIRRFRRLTGTTPGEYRAAGSGPAGP